ncbi:MAG: nitroreductase family protein [Candidatus Binatus sp.]|uniref:nitroreductase family protein n=1 Tax=Candidatus Binatus sp. TaxID=2811406 RepID=UPI00271E12F6|nr:nitroreductase family protein [Candidatus Binatus sp.]MDO8433403.1 nitroreductase family protein [Candidatus Binatus sp.]
MDLIEVMESNATCRSYKPDPVPDSVLQAAFDAARFGPQGGNRQPIRWVVVRDPKTKKQLKEWYLGPWTAYIANARKGAINIGASSRLLDRADNFAHHLDEVPAIVVVCAHIASLHVTDPDFDRPSVVGGASIYPCVQNFLLACRNLGLGTALTTLLCAFEPQVKELLSIPADFLTAAHIAVGYPAEPFPKKLKRRPVEEIVFAERFGVPMLGR